MHFMQRTYNFILLFRKFLIDFLYRSFLRDLQKTYNDALVMNTCSIGSAIASCFIKRVSS